MIAVVNVLGRLNVATIFVVMVATTEALGASASQAFLLPAALSIALATATPLAPYLQRRLGSRRLLLACTLGSGATSGLAALAGSFEVLVALLFIHGAFSAPISPATQALVAEHPSDRDRALGMTVWSASQNLSFLIGALLAGALATWSGWPAVLLIGPVLALAALPLVLARAARDAPVPRRGDITSLVLVPLAILLVLALATLGPALDWFASEAMVGLAAAAVAALIVAIIGYLRTVQPEFHVGCLADRHAALAVASVFLLNVVVTGIFQVELLGQDDGYATGELGLRTALGSAAQLAAFIVAGWLGRNGDWSGALLGGLFVLVLAHVGYLLYDAATPEWLSIGTYMLRGCGTALVMTSLAALAYRTLAPEHRAHVAACFALAIYLGAALGAGLLGEAFILVDGLALEHRVAPRGAEIAAFHIEFWAELAGVLMLFLPAWLLIRGPRPA